jgi:tetratricopeptide (TPR) repeat protein
MLGFRIMRALIVPLLAGLSLLGAAETALERARQYYARTDYQAALRTLEAVPQKSATIYELIGKSFYMQGEFKKSSQAFEQAVAADPNNSEYHNWLGRAYGRRAETASFLTAPGLASKARNSFERAFELNPRNLEAASDLFEYYLEAPGIMGGGLGKATDLANKIKALNPAEHHYMLARVAEKREQFRTAEEQLRLAVEFAPRQAGRIIDLAKFLAKQGRYQESEETFHRAEKVAPGSPRVLFERANLYVRSGRNLDTARTLLKQYLQATLTPDDPPRRDAERLLKKISES